VPTLIIMHQDVVLSLKMGTNVAMLLLTMMYVFVG